MSDKWDNASAGPTRPSLPDVAALFRATRYVPPRGFSWGWTQSVHWVAVLVAMNIMLLSGVQQFIPAPATSLVLLLLLALGTFLAGLNLSLLPFCFLGLALALAVPVITWLKQGQGDPGKRLRRKSAPSRGRKTHCDREAAAARTGQLLREYARIAL
jgi:hypothetical protein